MAFRYLGCNLNGFGELVYVDERDRELATDVRILLL
jgi:hypothetical protein